MLDMKNPCIVLEDVVCEGAYSHSCPRAITPYFREIWLERVEQPAGAPPACPAMADTHPLVSVGMPTRNGEHRVPAAIESALAQRYENIQVVISDNASTDGTEEVCRALAAADPRIRYHRQPENIGLFNNFVAVMHLAEGELFCWLGDDDEVNPAFIERSAEVLVADPARVLATTGVSWVGPDDSTVVRPYDPRADGRRPIVWPASSTC